MPATSLRGGRGGGGLLAALLLLAPWRLPIDRVHGSLCAVFGWVVRAVTQCAGVAIGACPWEGTAPPIPGDAHPLSPGTSWVHGRPLVRPEHGRNGCHFFPLGGPSGRDGGGQGAVVGAMVCLMAVPTRGDWLPVLACYVGCVEGWVYDIPRCVHALLVAPKHRIVGQPAHPSMLVGFADDEAHVGQHVHHPRRVRLRQDGHVRREGRRPCMEGSYFPLLRAACRLSHVDW